MKNILLAIAMLSQLTITTAEPKPSIPQSNPVQASRIAFINTTARSLTWLQNHHRELIKQRIPVMIIDGSAFVAKQLNQQYRGLLIGAAPTPIIHQRLLLKQLGVEAIPSVVEIKPNNHPTPTDK